MWHTLCNEKVLLKSVGNRKFMFIIYIRGCAPIHLITLSLIYVCMHVCICKYTYTYTHIYMCVCVFVAKKGSCLWYSKGNFNFIS